MTTEDTKILVLLFPQHLLNLTVNSSGYLELPTHKTSERETQNIKCKIPNFVS
jgi:hypothetical protein